VEREGKREKRVSKRKGEEKKHRRVDKGRIDSPLRRIVLLPTHETIRMLDVVLVILPELVLGHCFSDVEHPSPPDQRFLDRQSNTL